MKKKGVVDMCHRVLFGTSGTMANLPLTNNLISGSHVQHHNMVSKNLIFENKIISCFLFI